VSSALDSRPFLVRTFSLGRIRDTLTVYQYVQ
jgi:hypothetical protein